MPVSSYPHLYSPDSLAVPSPATFKRIPPTILLRNIWSKPITRGHHLLRYRLYIEPHLTPQKRPTHPQNFKCALSFSSTPDSFTTHPGAIRFISSSFHTSLYSLLHLSLSLLPYRPSILFPAEMPLTISPAPTRNVWCLHQAPHYPHVDNISP
jgi:hypothetical protein